MNLEEGIREKIQPLNVEDLAEKILKSDIVTITNLIEELVPLLTSSEFAQVMTKVGPDTFENFKGTFHER